VALVTLTAAGVTFGVADRGETEISAR
jgi:hypothetical protein